MKTVSCDNILKILKEEFDKINSEYDGKKISIQEYVYAQEVIGDIIIKFKNVNTEEV